MFLGIMAEDVDVHARQSSRVHAVQDLFLGQQHPVTRNGYREVSDLGVDHQIMYSRMRRGLPATEDQASGSSLSRPVYAGHDLVIGLEAAFNTRGERTAHAVLNTARPRKYPYVTG